MAGYFSYQALTDQDLLNESVAEWKRKKAQILHIGTIQLGPQFCPLCRVYFNSSSICEGCPVAKYTKKSCCGGTPCKEVIIRYLEYAFERGDLPTLLRAIDAETAFLERLRDNPDLYKEREKPTITLKVPPYFGPRVTEKVRKRMEEATIKAMERVAKEREKRNVFNEEEPALGDIRNTDDGDYVWAGTRGNGWVRAPWNRKPLLGEDAVNSSVGIAVARALGINDSTGIKKITLEMEVGNIVEATVVYQVGEEQKQDLVRLFTGGMPEKVS